MNQVQEKYQRLLSIYTKDQLNSLNNSKVCVAGLGGVGSYCATSLARAGIGNLILIDFDKIEESNINRQEFATEKTIGQKKVDVAKQFISSINNQINIDIYDCKIDEDNVSQIVKGANFIVDAIDDVNGKIAIAKFAQENQVMSISCMGTALKTDPFQLKFADIYETNTCPLCKAVRKLARENNIEQMQVLYSTEPSVKSLNDTMGSTSYLPPIAGLMLSSKVIKTIIKHY